MKWLFLLVLLLAGCDSQDIRKEVSSLRQEATIAKENAAKATTSVEDARTKLIDAKAKLAEAQATLEAEVEQKRLAAAELRRERIERVISVVTWICTVLGFLATFGLILSAFMKLPLPKSLFIAVITASAVTLAIGQSFGAMLGWLPLVGLVLIVLYVIVTAILLLSKHNKAASSIAEYSDKLEEAVLIRLRSLNAPDHIIKAIDSLVDEVKSTIHNDQIDNGIHNIVQSIRRK